MRVDLTTFGAGPSEQSKPGRGAQTNSEDDTAKTVASGASGDASSTGSSSASPVHQARFSFDQARVQSLAKQALAQPEIRQAKIDALQKAIGKGEHSVPASQVADAIVSDLVGAA